MNFARLRLAARALRAGLMNFARLRLAARALRAGLMNFARLRLAARALRALAQVLSWRWGGGSGVSEIPIRA
jgi:hypothetical protein